MSENEEIHPVNLLPILSVPPFHYQDIGTPCPEEVRESFQHFTWSTAAKGRYSSVRKFMISGVGRIIVVNFARILRASSVMGRSLNCPVPIYTISGFSLLRKTSSLSASGVCRKKPRHFRDFFLDRFSTERFRWTITSWSYRMPSISTHP